MSDQTAIAELGQVLQAVDPLDPSSLIPVLEGFEKLAKDDALETPCREAAGRAAQLTEKIILAEVADPQKALEGLQAMAEALNQAAAGELDPDAIPELAWTEPDSDAQGEEAPEDDQPPEDEETKAMNAQLFQEFSVETEDHLDASEASLLEIEGGADWKSRVDAIFRAFHTIKGASSFLHLKRMSRLTHDAENLLKEIRDGRLTFTKDRITLLLEVVDMLRTLNKEVKGEIKTDAAFDEKLNQMVPTIKQSLAMTEEDKKILAGGADKADGLAGGGGASGEETGKKSDKILRVPMGRVDDVLNLVGELAVLQSMVFQSRDVAAFNSPALQRQVAEVQKVTRVLQSTTMSMRMVSVKRLFQRMLRVIRDVSNKTGKEVKTVLSGEDTEIDRRIVEKMADPLIHIVRNAVDHGIETAEERTLHGKPPEGTVHLDAFHEAGTVVIQVTDNGKGINPERIRQKAFERGLIQEGDPLDQKLILDCLCSSGFSLAQKTTEFSGRGVGLDVVRQTVMDLKGDISLQSEPGQGTTWRISMPLTLAIIEGITISCCQQSFILPVDIVERSLTMEAAQRSTIQDKDEILSLDDGIVPIWRLSSLLNLTPPKKDAEARSSHQGAIVLIKIPQGRFALMVDAVLRNQQVVVKGLGERFDGLVGISGCTIMEEGQVTLILDGLGLMKLGKGEV